MEKANKDIRKAIKDSNLKYYVVANAYGMTDGNFSRLLRFELSEEKKAKIMAIIDQLKANS